MESAVYFSYLTHDTTPLKPTILVAYEDRAEYTPFSGYCWGDIVEEVIERKAQGKKANLLSEKEGEYCKRKLPEKIRFGTKHGSTYFTRRETECMIWLLKGKTINSIAKILKLSPRTVEYYIKNMKNKVDCRTKFELIDLIHASEFVKKVSFYVKI